MFDRYFTLDQKSAENQNPKNDVIFPYMNIAQVSNYVRIDENGVIGKQIILPKIQIIVPHLKIFLLLLKNS